VAQEQRDAVQRKWEIKGKKEESETVRKRSTDYNFKTSLPSGPAGEHGPLG
jgi:hypothetical protein